MVIFALAAAVALGCVASAHAAGGDYAFDGGDAAARAEVRSALEASSFPWDVVPVRVTIHIARDVQPHATPGDIWLDPRLLKAGRFSWGIVQHEYAHQVAFFVFGREERALLTRLLGGRAWCHERSGMAHDAQACERFASMLAWAYWPSEHNVERPARRASATSLEPRLFRRLMAGLLSRGER